MSEGGCLCGTLRYQVTGEPRVIVHCHCQTCQRSSGSAFVTWATYRPDQVKWTQGELKIFASSAKADRGFCSNCGTPIAFFTYRSQDDRRELLEIDVTVCSLDQPDALTPQCHIWTSSQRAWIHLADALRRHADEKAELGEWRSTAFHSTSAIQKSVVS